MKSKQAPRWRRRFRLRSQTISQSSGAPVAVLAAASAAFVAIPIFGGDATDLPRYEALGIRYVVLTPKDHLQQRSFFGTPTTQSTTEATETGTASVRTCEKIARKRAGQTKPSAPPLGRRGTYFGGAGGFACEFGIPNF